MSVKALKKPIEQFVKFNLIGVVNSGIDFLVFSLLLWLGIFAIGAQCISYTAGTLNSYYMNSRFTFNNGDIQHQRKFGVVKFFKFLIINLLVLGCSLPLLHILIEKFGFHPLGAKLVVTCGTVIINFLATRTWIFTEKRANNPEG